MTDRDDPRPPPGPPSPAEVEEQIRRTRAELAQTIDALDRKLTARHLVEKGFDMIRDSVNTSETLHRSLDIMRANPVPVALIGLGTAWLIASSTGVAERIAQDERVEAARRRVSDLASDIGNRAGELASDVAGRVGLSGGEGDRPLGHTGHPMLDESGRDRGNGWMHQMTDVAQDALRSAGGAVNRAGSYAGDGATRVADQVGAAFERNPLMVGAIGVMAGALIAALLPLTRLENEMLGTSRDELFQKAEEAGEQAIQRVRDAASEAAVRAVDAAAGAAVETVRTIGGDKPPQGSAG
jgi:Protein of unknown function (DUF3618)